MRFYKIAISDSKKYDQILSFLQDFSESDFENIKDQIVTDVKNFYSSGNLPPQKTYTINNYSIKVFMIPSNNGTFIDTASTHFLKIKLLNLARIRDYSKTEQDIQNNINFQIEKIKREMFTLKHEMQHYHIETKNPGRILTYQQSQKWNEYFDDPEELVLHCKSIWEYFIQNYKISDRTMIIEKLKRIISSWSSIINSPFPMKKKTQEKYLKFIIDKFLN